MIEIKPLEPHDLTEAGIVVETAFGRRGMAESLRKVYELQPGYWFCVRRLDRIIATVGAYGYRGSASIGMMSVHPQFQHQGLGGQLMEHLIHHLTLAGYPALFLEASSPGQLLYPKLGFWPGGDTLRMIQRTPVKVRFPAGGAVDRMVASDLREVIAYDGCVFGLERPLILQAFFERNPGRAFIARDGSQALAGYVFASGMTLGPWSAGSPAAAQLLLQAALTLPRSGKPRVTLPADNRAGLALLSRYGFVEAEGLLHMRLGSLPDPRRRTLYYGQASLMLG
jgi:predicted N-acetyltransferase YhbS